MYRLSDSNPSIGCATVTNFRKTTKKHIKNIQKLELVRLMKANFLFIRGKHTIVRSEKSRAEVWNTIAIQLNRLGPPRQSAKTWQKRWNDMRSATNRKMLKIQSYNPEEEGEECPYQLTEVERMIWDTFEVNPEQYMRDLNMKLWRERKSEFTQQPTSYSTSSCSSQISTEQSVETGWNPMATTFHHTGSEWNNSTSFANSIIEDFNRTTTFYPAGCSSQQEPHYEASQPLGMYYVEPSGHSINNNTTGHENIPRTNDWASAVPSSDTTNRELCTPLNPGHENALLQDINTKLNLIQMQNDKIINMLQANFSLL